MQQEIKNHKVVERYLNKVVFNGIRIGSLIAYYYSLNFISKKHARPIFTNLLVLLKYGLTLWNRNKKIEMYKADFIFTKLNNRFHFNALMDPLILHYYNNSIILCDDYSFDKNKFDIQKIQKKAINFIQTNSNSNEDAWNILMTIVTAFYCLIKNRKRLKLSFHEVVYFGKNLLVQLRRTSFWDHYFNKADPKPSCVVTEYDRFSGTAPLVLAAQKHKMQTITLIHGVIEEYSFTPFLADYIFCWGESQKSQLIAKYVDPRQIIITGNPMFDYKVPEVYSGVHVINELRICLAISPGFDNRLLIEIYLSALNQLGNSMGMLKLHPSLNKVDFQWVKTISSKLQVLDSSDIKNSDLFRKIDLLIINDSGIANEALAAGVPVAVLVPDCYSEINNYQNELVIQAKCRLVRDELGLKNIFIDILTDPLGFRKDSVEKSNVYLKNLCNYKGEESERAMIFEIDRLSGRSDSISK